MSKESFSGIVLDDECSLTIEDLCNACHANKRWVIELVDEGIIEPYGRDINTWYFSGVSLQRALRARRLQQDLGINIAGAALVIDLMDQIQQLESRLFDIDCR